MGFFGVVLGGGRQREEKKKKKTQFIVSCQPYKTVNESKKTEDQKRIKQNCFHRGYVRRCAYFGSRSRSRRWPAAGREEKMKKTQFIVFCQPYKTPNGSKKIVRNRYVPSVGAVFSKALVQCFICFGENYVRPRPIQTGRIGGPGRG